MTDLNLLLPPQTAPQKDTVYLSKECSPSEKKIVCFRGTTSLPGHYRKDAMKFYFRYQEEVGGRLDLAETILGQIYGMPTISLESGIWSPPKNLTVSDVLTLMKQRPILFEETDEIKIVPLREIPYEYAKLEITRYIQSAGGRKVYISELVEELRLDIELIMEVMEELKTETRD